MSKLTKKAIENIKKESDNRLTKKVCNMLLDKGTAAEIESYIKDLMYGGCVSGMEGTLIYYTDTVAFFKKYADEIKEMLKESMKECGYKSPAEIFGDKWDDEDIFAEADLNRNLLAWYAFEETVRNIASEAGMEV
jgi:hypothetical protein